MNQSLLTSSNQSYSSVLIEVLSVSFSLKARVLLVYCPYTGLGIDVYPMSTDGILTFSAGLPRGPSIATLQSTRRLLSQGLTRNGLDAERGLTGRWMAPDPNPPQFRQNAESRASFCRTFLAALKIFY